MAQHNELRKVMQDIVEKLEAMGFALRGDKPKENEWMVRKNSRHSEAGSSLYYFDDEKRPFFVINRVELLFWQKKGIFGL